MAGPWYVRKTGNDGSAGTSAGAAFLTIQQAIDSVTSTGGEQIWVGAGRYAEVLTWPTGYTSMTTLSGDVTGANTGDSGTIIVTPYTSGRTTDPGATSYTVTTPGTAGTPASYFTEEDIHFIGADESNHQLFYVHNVTLRRCVFSSALDGQLTETLRARQPTATAFALLFDSCVFLGTPNVVGVELFCSTDETIDADVTVQNCFFTGGSSAEDRSALCFEDEGASGSLSGIEVLSCTFAACNTPVGVDGTTGWATDAVKVRGCLFVSCWKAFDADDTTPIDEDYNLIEAAFPRTNVDAGANSQVVNDREILIEAFDSFLWPSGTPRPPYSPLDNDTTQIDFDAEASDATMPTVDMLGRPRPLVGLNRTAGCFERANTAVQETTTVPSGEDSAIKFVGPMIQDVQIPVDASSTTITVEARQKTGYTGTKPTMSVLNGGEAGVSDATDTVTVADDTWDTLTLTFTPTSIGVVTVRFASTDTSGTGESYFGKFAKS